MPGRAPAQGQPAHTRRAEGTAAPPHRSSPAPGLAETGLVPGDGRGRADPATVGGVERRVAGWTLEEELGRGGLGVVFRARHEDGRLAALKLLIAPPAPAARARLEGELRALLRLDHPHVVRVLDAGQDQGRPWLAMELIAGESLQALLEREGPLPPARAVAVIRALAGALTHCHAQGVLHRDLKPDNVLLDRQGWPRLVDFGLALELDGSGSRLTRTGQLLGTPGYWSPEQARGDLQALDGRTDVYALGATLFALLTGQPPFSAGSLVEALQQVERDPAPPPSRLAPRVDPALDALVLRCLAKAPAARFPTAAALEAALAAWESAPRGRARRGRRGLPWAAASLVVLLLLAGGWSWRRSLRAGRRAQADALGAEARGAGSWAEARRLLEEALRLDETAARHMALAEVLHHMNEPRAAAEAAQRALALEPENPACWTLRASLRQPAEARLALEDIERALALAPERPGLWSMRAMAHEDLGDDRAALADMDQAVRLEPLEPNHLIVRNAIKHRLGDREGAALDLERAARLGGDEPHVLWQVGSRKLEQGDREGGLRDQLSAILRSGLGERGKLTLYSDERLRRGELEALGRELEQLLQAGETAERRFCRAKLRYRRRQLEGAAADLSRALELDPRDPQTWSLLGVVDYQRGREEGAEQAFSRALELRPGWRDVLRNRAAARIALGRFEAARADLDALLGERDEDAASWGTLGVWFHRQERWREAIEAYERAIALDPRDGSVQVDRAIALLRAGREAEARAAAADVRRRFPGTAVDQRLAEAGL